MFLQSIPLGFKQFFSWQCLLLTLAFLGLHLLFAWVLRLTTGAKESEGAAAPGCLIQILSVLFEGFWVGLYALVLMPLLLGLSSELSWTAIESFILLASRAGVLLSLAVGILSLIPWIGRWISGSPGIEIFLIASGVLRLTAPLFVEKSPLGQLGGKATFPGLLQSLGYLLLAFVLSKLLMLLVDLLRNPLKSRPKADEFLLKTGGPSLDLLGGLIAWMMFASFVRLSLGH